MSVHGKCEFYSPHCHLIAKYGHITKYNDVKDELDITFYEDICWFHFCFPNAMFSKSMVKSLSNTYGDNIVNSKKSD